MNHPILFALVVVAIFAKPSFAADLSAMPLKTAFSGAGGLVILKGETISGLNPDGTPTTQQDVTYYGENESLTANKDYYAKTAGQFTCTAMVQTTDNNHDGGFDVTLGAGTSIAWDHDVLSGNILEEPFVDNGVTYQGLRLTFSAARSKLSVMYCTIAGAHASETLTIKDFENATGGKNDPSASARLKILD